MTNEKEGHLEQNLQVSDFFKLDRFDGAVHPCDHAPVSSFTACLAKPPASRWAVSRSRRLLDFTISFLVLVVGALPMLLLAACVRLTSKGNVIFSQERLGLRGRIFKVYKFRSMVHTANENNGPGLTRNGDSRITPLGHVMRKLKLDELPQFYNVLRGDMSLVGPRPKLPQYAAFLNMPYRPGITGPATLAFCHEEEMLRNVNAAEIDSFYAREIKPVKARLDACYMCHATPASDASILGFTLLGCLHLDPAILGLPAALLQMLPAMSSGQPTRARAFGASGKTFQTRLPSPAANDRS